MDKRNSECVLRFALKEFEVRVEEIWIATLGKRITTNEDLPNWDELSKLPGADARVIAARFPGDITGSTDYQSSITVLGSAAVNRDTRINRTTFLSGWLEVCIRDGSITYKLTDKKPLIQHSKDVYHFDHGNWKTHKDVLNVVYQLLLAKKERFMAIRTLERKLGINQKEIDTYCEREVA